MASLDIDKEPSKQWELLLLLITSEERKIDRSGEDEVETMNYFYTHEGIRKILLNWLSQMIQAYAHTTSKLDTSKKCNQIATEWKQQGNTCFNNNKLEESYACYCKSIIYASRDSGIYAIALANRSAVLLKLQRHKDCVSDIDLAIKHEYPKEQRHKLYLRKAECFIELGDMSEASIWLEKAEEHSNLATSVVSSTFEKNLKMSKEKLKGEINSKTLEQEDSVASNFIENPEFVAASISLHLRSSDAEGRYVVCHSNLLRGAVLFIEEPYAFVALPLQSSFPLVCENCCKTSPNIISCTVCSRSVYCGEDCRLRGWERFHRWECIGAQSNIWPTIGIAHLALRVLLISTSRGMPPISQKSFKEHSASEIYKHYTVEDSIKIFGKDVDDFYRVFNLVTNFKKISMNDYVQYALTAVMLTLYLEHHTDYFQYAPSKMPFTMSDCQLRLYVASCLLRHMGQLVCNGHAVTALVDSPGGAQTSSVKQMRLATAIYPSVSMMNHSCDPNTITSFDGSRLIVKASRAIAEGEQVCNCYGPLVSNETLRERRAMLRQQYLFHCNCVGCTDPDRGDFVLQFTAYSCHLCKGPVILESGKALCKQCKSTELNLNKTLETLNRAKDIMKQAEVVGSAADRVQLISSALKLKQQALHRHHRAVRDAMDKLACSYADIGDFSKCVDVLKQCIPSLEYQYGSFSIEVAHELHKLAEVMMERVLSSPQHPDYREWCLETHKIIKKALQLFDLNYGPWDPTHKMLKQKETLIKELLAKNQGPTTDQSIHSMMHYNLKI